MPRLTPKQKELQRDKAVIRSEVATLRSPATTAAEKERATQTIALTVLKGTKLTATVSATEDTPKLLANLAATLDPGSVALSGVDVAIQGAAIKLGIPKTELETIPEVVKQRLDKLV